MLIDLGNSVLEAFLALLPFVIIFILLQIFILKLKYTEVITIGRGLLLSFIGLGLFLYGINVSFIDGGIAVGKAISLLKNNWIMFPLAFLLGFIVTLAEPAVKILVNEIEQMTTGYIRPKLFVIFLAVGVGFSVSLAILRILMGISFWYLIIISYATALILSYFTSPLFVAVAFDAGGVAVGPLVTAFLLGIIVSYAETVSSFEAVVNGFGALALVTIFPVIMVLILGCIYERKGK